MVVGNWKGGLTFYSTNISTGLVSTQQVDPGFNLNIAPNPAKSQISIMINQFDTDSKWLNLYDASGQKVLERQWNSNRLDLDINHLPKGLYFARVSVNDVVKVEKVIIQ